MIRIAAAHITPRLKYSADFVFRIWLGIPYSLYELSADAEPNQMAIFYGSNEGVAHGKWGLHVPACGLLHQRGVHPVEIIWDRWDELPVLFPVKEGDLPFDLFAAVFFCLSRYEEYGTVQRDAHGRYPSAASVLKPYIERPLVDEWLLAFEQLLIHRGLMEKPALRNLRWINTIDIDIAYAYRGRGVLRGIGAYGKDLLGGKWSRIRERFCVLSGLQSDPYDTYELVRTVSENAGETVFFVLCGERGGLDINLNPKSRSMRNLIALLNRWAVLGIHPSYASHTDASILAAEVALLSEILESEVICSRQHFLKFHLPDTYQLLAAAGIKRDYSMGYADAIGFRSGTAHPHLFYNLLRDETTELELVPLIAMDSAMLHYMKLTPAEALAKLNDLWAKATPTGGNFITLWHNHSLSERDEWKGWRDVYKSFAELAKT